MGKYFRLAQNMGLFLLNALATKFMSFILMPLYTGHLSVTQYGVLDLANVVINLIFPIATLSISTGVLRFVIGDQENACFYISEGMTVCVLSCIAVALALPLLDLPFFGGLGAYKPWFLASYVAATFQTYLGSVARSLNQIKLISMAAIASSLCMGVSAFLLIALFEMELIGYFISLIAGSLVSSAILFVGGTLWKYMSFQVLRGRRQERNALYRFSIPLAPNSICWSLGTTISRFLITNMLGVGASGLYAAASRVPNLLNSLQQVFSQAWEVSSFQEYREREIGRFYSIVWRVYRLAMMLGSGLVIILSPTIASILLQGDYYQVWPLIPLLVCSFYIDAANSFMGVVYQVKMQTRPLFVTTIAGAAACVSVTAVLLPMTGITAACIGVLVGNGLVLVARYYGVKGLLDVEWGIGKTVVSIGVLLFEALVMLLQPKGFTVLASAAFLLAACAFVFDMRYVLAAVYRMTRRHFVRCESEEDG